MAELADAHGSGPCERKFLQVQLLLSAPIKFFNMIIYSIASVAILRRFVTQNRIVSTKNLVGIIFYIIVFKLTYSKNCKYVFIFANYMRNWTESYNYVE